jgi:murein DD-endopeptidase MepM/ murein hydrolase activator NlpD
VDKTLDFSGYFFKLNKINRERAIFSFKGVERTNLLAQLNIFRYLKKISNRKKVREKGKFSLLFNLKQKKRKWQLSLLIFGIILSLFLIPVLKNISSERNSPFSLLNNLQANLFKSSEIKNFNQFSLSSKVFASKIDSFEDPGNFILLQKNSLKNFSPPVILSSQTLGIMSEAKEMDDRKEIVEYTVKEGDSVSSVAEQFGVSLNTLLWANNLSPQSKLQAGQKLIILPVSGVLHYVKKGETLSQIAKTYKGDLGEIIAYNELDNEEDIYVGDIIIIPNGVMPFPQASPKKPKTRQFAPFSQSFQPIHNPLPSNYFIPPLSSPYIITQGLHWYNAVDLGHPGGNSCGRPVFAAAGGQIIRTKTGGWNGGAGNLVYISHPNQVVTAYFHLGTILVQEGQTVSAGEQIGTIGNTGKTTGCHLHFEVRGAVNPFIQ